MRERASPRTSLGAEESLTNHAGLWTFRLLLNVRREGPSNKHVCTSCFDHPPSASSVALLRVGLRLARARGGVLTGTFQPDARNVSPFSVLDTSPWTAFLSSFDGLDPNGTWTLFIADVSPVGIGTLDSWSLTVDGTGPVGVPDGGSTVALLAVGMICLAFRFRRGDSASVMPAGRLLL